MRHYQGTGGIKIWTADKWFSKCIRHAADYICQRCRQKDATDCAHIYTRRKIATRWCKDNALALCRGCHQHFEENPLDMADFIDALDSGRRERLRLLLRSYVKNNEQTRKIVSDHYRKEYNRMVAEDDNDFASWN